MSINAILGNAVSALHTSQAALRTTSQNVANVNSVGYVRRETQLESLHVGGEDLGVRVAEVRRMAADFMSREILVATGESGLYSAMQEVHDRIQGLLGPPDSEYSLSQQVGNALAGASSLTLDPSSAPRRLSFLSELESTLRSLSNLSEQVLALRGETDNSVAISTDNASSLIKQIYDLNVLISKGEARGEGETTLNDQRDQAIRELSELVGIRAYEQPNGAIHIETTTGFSLVGETYVELDYQPTTYSGADIVFDPILAYRVNPQSGERTGTGRPLDEHLTSGRIAGLLDMRDTELPNVASEIGALAGALADQLNAVHNDSIAVPPPNTLSGRNTGLLGTDAHGFQGQTTLAIVDETGALVRRVDIDFTAGTYSVNGGAAAALGATMSAVETSLNAALGGDGSASFTAGVLTISATDTDNGVGFAQPDTGGSSRSGRSFSQFFGLNDLVSAKRPSHFATGLDTTDAQGFAAGETIDFVIRGPNGEVAAEVNFAMPAGTTLADVVTALNNTTTGVGTYMTFLLDGNGQMIVTPTSAYQGYKLDVAGDGTARGATGQSFSEIFGVGRRFVMEQAHDLAIAGNLIDDPDQLALARLDIDGTTVVGDIVATIGDNRGALALVSASEESLSFGAVGGLGATIATLGDFASLMIARTSNEASGVETLATATAAIKDEVEVRRQNIEGVNLDEELSQMIVYQQAYNAAARLVTMAKEVYDQLINIL